MNAVTAAIETLQKRGSLDLVNGRIRYRGGSGDVVQQAINTLRQNRNAALAALTTPESGTVPPAEAWPESLLDLAQERAAQTGDPEAARKEIWHSWCEWKALDLNRLFQERGRTGKPGRITADTVQDGLDHEIRRRAKQ